MDSSKNYYAILGVEFSATKKEIKAAHRKLALKHHPDLHKGIDSKKMAEINAAYETLGNEAKKKEYDKKWRGHYSDGSTSQKQTHYRKASPKQKTTYTHTTQRSQYRGSSTQSPPPGGTRTTYSPPTPPPRPPAQPSFFHSIAGLFKSLVIIGVIISVIAAVIGGLTAAPPPPTVPTKAQTTQACPSGNPIITIKSVTVTHDPVWGDSSYTIAGTIANPTSATMSVYGVGYFVGDADQSASPTFESYHGFDEVSNKSGTIEIEGIRVVNSDTLIGAYGSMDFKETFTGSVTPRMGRPLVVGDPQKVTATARYYDDNLISSYDEDGIAVHKVEPHWQWYTNTKDSCSPFPS